MNLHVGQKASRTVTITADHVKTFAELTGDYNPLHFEEAFAAQTKFKRLVVQTEEILSDDMRQWWLIMRAGTVR